MAPPPEFEFGGRAADDTGKRRTRLPQTCLARVLICSTGTFGPFLSGSMDRSNGRQTVLTPAYQHRNVAVAASLIKALKFRLSDVKQGVGVETKSAHTARRPAPCTASDQLRRNGTRGGELCACQHNAEVRRFETATTSEI
jgi:hypothetical protein